MILECLERFKAKKEIMILPYSHSPSVEAKNREPSQAMSTGHS